MTQTITIRPLAAPFQTSLRPPGSKSLSNRAMVLAALADGPCTLRGTLEADDTQRMREAMTALGFVVEHDAEAHVTKITGQAGSIPKSAASLFLGNAGTAFRFMTAFSSLGKGPYELTGIDRMHQRPIGQLVEPLRELGATINCLQNEGYPPLQITGSEAGKLRGGELLMQPTLSSQYISALLQVAPYCEQPLTLVFDGPVTSQPYVQMTLSLMYQFGIESDVDPAFTRITVPQGSYKAGDYEIEPDASTASYFLGAAAIIPGSKCTIEGLGFRSVQGDAQFPLLLQRMGAAVICEPTATTVVGLPEGEKLKGIDVDLNQMPDMAQTLAVLALFAEGPTTIRNVGNLRVKETDRMAALQNELTKLGATVEIDEDDLRVTPPADGKVIQQPGDAVNTYDDHRMAMSFAIAGLASPAMADGLVIDDPDCCSKSFPNYFEVLAEVTGGTFERKEGA